jgi:ribose 5-phosphate isomerase A
VDVAIDGADEVDPALNCIKGGGGCHLQEKLVAAYAKQFVVIADFRKQSPALGTVWRKGVPVEVTPLGWAAVAKALTAMGGVPVLRKAVAKAGPVVTDNGNFILDVDFGVIADPVGLQARLSALVGVLETGLFCSMACKAYFGMDDGSVQVWEPAVAPAAPTPPK